MLVTVLVLPVADIVAIMTFAAVNGSSGMPQCSFLVAIERTVAVAMRKVAAT